MRTSETTSEIFKALAKAQGGFSNVARDLVASTGTYSYAYADLGACLDVVRESLEKHGLAVVQSPQFVDGDVVVETMLTHESGEWIDCGKLAMTPQRPGPQSVGSCITYARRYALAAVLGLAQTDDDAQSAEGRPQAETHLKILSSMTHAIKLIDEIEEGDYELFKATWADLDPAVRQEITRRKPRQMEAWKAKYKGTSSDESEKAVSN